MKLGRKFKKFEKMVLTSKEKKKLEPCRYVALAHKVKSFINSKLYVNRVELMKLWLAENPVLYKVGF